MAESNQDGRNQKLVIDYLEALLSDSDNEDSIIIVESEIAKTNPSSAVKAEAVEMTQADSDEQETVSTNNDEASVQQASSQEALEQVDDELVDDVEIVDVQEEWAEIEAEQADEFLVDSMSDDLQDSEQIAEGGLEESLDTDSLEAENLETESLEVESLDAEHLENVASQQVNEVAEEAQQESEQSKAEFLAIDEAINDTEEAIEMAAPEAELIAVDLTEDDLEILENAQEQDLDKQESDQSELEVTDTDTDTEEQRASSNESEDQSAELSAAESEVLEEVDDNEEQQGIAEQDVSDPEAEQNAAMIEKEAQEADAQMDIDESRSEEAEAEKPVELSINCIIVLMYGLKLAIPFEQFEGHIKLSNVTLSLDNDRDWILGDFTSSTMRTHVVDTAQILFGDNYDALNSNYNEMLVLEGKHWSIVFDKVIKTQNVLLSDVTENPSPQFRPWLTGTYMPEKCALVNVSAMVKMFEDELNGSLT